MSEKQQTKPATPAGEGSIGSTRADLGRERVREILRERARELARRPETDESGESVSLMVLAVGTERFGVDIRKIQEVKPLAELTPVPYAPQVWTGVVNLRGDLYPVLDLRRYFDLPEAGSAPSDPKIAVARGSGTSVALMADDVLEVRRVPVTQVGTPITEGSGPGLEAVAGVTSDLLTVLDLDVLMSDPTLTVKDETT